MTGGAVAVGTYRRHIENRIRAGNTALPRLDVCPTVNLHEERPVGFGFAGSASPSC